MPAKWDAHKTPGEKLIGLYSLLVFTERPYSLTRLAELLGCSRQTVLRLIEQIERSNQIGIESWLEGGQRHYRARGSRRAVNVSLDAEGIHKLLLCRDIVQHLLPDGMRAAVDESLGKAAHLGGNGGEHVSPAQSVASALPKGAIDYSPHEDVLRQVLDAIRNRRICTLRYRSPSKPEASEMTLAPYALVAFRDGLYLRGRLQKALANPQDYYDPTLAVHRIEAFAATDEPFEPITDAETGKPELSFGLITGSPFEAVVDVTAGAAAYVKERVWSSNQKIEVHADGSITIRFTSTSEPEVLAWVLSFGEEAVLREPARLRERIQDRLCQALGRYGDHNRPGGA